MTTATDDIIRIDLSAVEVLGSKAAIGRALKRLEPDVIKIRDLFLERIRANAPILDGTLRAGLYVTYKIDPSAMTVEFEAGGTAPYTLRMHESVYNLGPISIRQPHTPEGNVGRKFVTRVLDFWLPHWGDILGGRLAEYLGEEIIV